MHTHPTPTTTDRLRQIAVVATAVSQVAAGSLLQAFGNQPDIGTISDRYPTLVVPAGYAFSIWGLIYLWSLAYAVFQALPAQRQNPLLRRVGWWSALAFLGSSLWTVAFQHLQFGLSVVIMLVILTALARTVAHCTRHPLTPRERWWVAVPLSIYLGWITVATLANVTQTLVAYGWNGWGLSPAVWAGVMLLVAGGIAATVVAAIRTRGAYAATVSWALVATAVNQWQQTLPVALVALGVVVMLAVMVVATARRTPAAVTPL